LRALDIKVLRDLVRLRGQVAAIGLVFASGVAVMIMALSTLEALRETTTTYYEQYRFADVFAQLKRAPQHFEERIAALEGVRTVETRVKHYATLDVADFDEPVLGQFVSLPASHQPRLNHLVIRNGRYPLPSAPDEVLLNEPFAEAHGLRPGDRLAAILNGHRRILQVAGIALSPEFIYSLGPGALMPDNLRFGVVWANGDMLAAAFDLQEAFNDVVIELTRGTQPESVIKRLDDLLERYGGAGAIARADQMSNWFLMNEMEQLTAMSRVLPAIFLGISAFLTHMVLARLVATERTQIGLMKAFGYSNLQVGLHYGKLVSGIAVVGIAAGVAVGTWFGRINTEQYAEFFRFPLLIYRPSGSAFLIAGGLSLLAAFGGALSAVRRATAIPPAQAMQPPAPPTFRHSLMLGSRAGLWLDQPTRIILRNIGRWPVRAALTVTGIAASVGLLVLALQWKDSIDYLADSYFFQSQRQHVTIGLAEARSTRVINEFRHMPAVLAVEPMRMVSADFHHGPLSHRGSLTGVAGAARLQPIYDDATRTTLEPPPDGLVLGRSLAEKLAVGPGDSLRVRLLEGRRPDALIPVVRLVDTWIGMPAYIHIDAMNRLLQERPSTEYLNLLVDSSREASLYRELKSLPMVSAVSLRQAAIDSFYDTIAEHMLEFIAMFSILAGILGVGVAYNSTRVALSERSRELATLRVLGFSGSETAYILLGEIALLIAVALPLGCLAGRGLSQLMAALFATELFRVPMVIEPATYGISVLIVLFATGCSAAIVGRRVQTLDLIEVLKTKE
jgi:putative ABC transport system permease protein